MNPTLITPAFFVHEKAICESQKIGEGTRIWGFSHVLPGAVIGKGCNLGEHVFVENHVSIGNGCTIKNGVSLWDKVTLEDDVFVGPHAVFTNDMNPRAFSKKGQAGFLPTHVCRGATIGANATIVCGVTIGEYAFVGAGAVVTRDVAPYTLVVGNPARAIGKVDKSGNRLDN
ncbi:MAG: N-acetyltransferase [Bdellovibrionales bacterium]|nr:N-acetyltransferase [Bdellovibrionales bacterium]